MACQPGRTEELGGVRVTGAHVQRPSRPGSRDLGDERTSQGRGVAEQWAAHCVNQHAHARGRCHVDHAGRVVAGGEHQAVAFHFQSFRLGPGGHLLQSAGPEQERAGAFEGALDGGEPALLAECGPALASGGDSTEQRVEPERLLSGCWPGA